MLKRLFAVLGCVLLVITCFVVPVGAETSSFSVGAFLTNRYSGDYMYWELWNPGINVLIGELEPSTTYYIIDGAGGVQTSFISTGTGGIPDNVEFDYTFDGVGSSRFRIERDGEQYTIYDVMGEYTLGTNATDGYYWYLALYTVSNASSDRYNEGYADGEVVGYENGYRAGDADGYNRGYALGEQYGYNVGQQDGYSTGYNDGLENGSGITWTGLFTSAIEVPVNVLQGILNFEILGVNLWSFFGAIVALCVVLIVVKWVI